MSFLNSLASNQQLCKFLIGSSAMLATGYVANKLNSSKNRNQQQEQGMPFISYYCFSAISLFGSYVSVTGGLNNAPKLEQILMENFGTTFGAAALHSYIVNPIGKFLANATYNAAWYMVRPASMVAEGILNKDVKCSLKGAGILAAIFVAPTLLQKAYQAATKSSNASSFSRD